MSQTKNQAIENQKLKLENEQLKAMNDCLRNQIHEFVQNAAKEELSLREVLDEIFAEPKQKTPQVNIDEIKIGDSVVYSVSPDSLYVGTVKHINEINQVFLENAVFLQFKNQIRFIKHDSDCCIADAIKLVMPKPTIPNPKN